MFLSELKIWNFRKFGEGKNSSPGLHVSFNSGLNLLVGENDSGKTAIIDAIKMVLFTQSYDYYRLEDEDFFIPRNVSEEGRTKELTIECIFRDFTPHESKHFLEWLGFEDGQDGIHQYFLKVFLKARRENGRIYQDIKAGSDEQGTALDGRAHDLLRTVYLRPLRDAEVELNPRRKSRLSQILYSHKDFAEKEGHPIKKAVDGANKQIQEFFEVNDASCQKKEGTIVVRQINNHLSNFSSVNNPLKSSISIADMNLRTILEQLSLSLSNNKVGLGSNNLTKSNFNHLGEYLQKIDVKDANYYRKSIINALLKVLRLLDIKNETNSRYFSERSLIQYLSMKNSDLYSKLNLKMAEWCLKIHNNVDIFTELKEFIENDFCPFFKITNPVAIKEFLNNDSSSKGGCQKFQPSNIFCHESNINIEVATIHSVKGETHAATLYLETYYDKGFDIKRIINYLQGSHDGPNYIQSLKMAYVGMSRPTHLLCVAAHKDTVSGNETFLQKMGWMIKNICDKEQPTKGMKSNYQATLMSMI